MAATLALGRGITYTMVRHLRARGPFRQRALILGAGVVGRDLAAAMTAQPWAGFEPVAFLDNDPQQVPESPPLLNARTTLSEAIRENAVDHVFVAFSSARERDVVEIIRTCDRLDCEISIVPRLFELMSRGHNSDELNGIPLTHLRRGAFRSATWPAKRMLDIVVAGVALLLLAPVLIAVAVLLRVTDGRGVVFRQVRVGIGGGTFELLKFKTLRPPAGASAEAVWNVANDARVTRVGRVLRRTSLDELPQLLNILRGDMSLVGPRPERPQFVDEFGATTAGYRHRHRVPCGLTGWAQIHGLRGDTSIAERARFDNYYIENWSLWLDVKILLKTFATLTKGAG